MKTIKGESSVPQWRDRLLQLLKAAISEDLKLQDYNLRVDTLSVHAQPGPAYVRFSCVVMERSYRLDIVIGTRNKDANRRHVTALCLLAKSHALDFTRHDPPVGPDGQEDRILDKLVSSEQLHGLQDPLDLAEAHTVIAWFISRLHEADDVFGPYLDGNL